MLQWRIKMALSINQTLSDSSSSACFEVSTDRADGEANEDVTIITPADLAGAGADPNQSVMITRVIATVAKLENADQGFVTLSWGEVGSLTDFLHLPAENVTDLNIAFKSGTTGPGSNVVLNAPEGIVFTLRIYAKKMTGFPLSMGHGAHRP